MAAATASISIEAHEQDPTRLRLNLLRSVSRGDEMHSALSALLAEEGALVRRGTLADFPSEMDFVRSNLLFYNRLAGAFRATEEDLSFLTTAVDTKTALLDVELLHVARAATRMGRPLEAIELLEEYNRRNSGPIPESHRTLVATTVLNCLRWLGPTAVAHRRAISRELVLDLMESETGTNGGTLATVLAELSGLADSE